MNVWQRFLWRILPLGVLLCFAAIRSASGADSLSWKHGEKKVSAEITSWDLPKVLESIARATGWQIFVEPDTKKKVSTKFKDRSPGEALGLLLSDLSFALLPQSNGPSRLFVFHTSLQEATKLIRPDPKSDPTAKPIPNELIVTLKKGAKIDDLAKKLGAKVTGRVDGLNAYRLSFDGADEAQAARDQLKDNSDVDSIDSNFNIQRPEPLEATTYSSPAPPLELKPRTSTGAPIVGLIDTPIQKSGGSLDAFLLPGISVAGDAQPSDSSPTHGTSMYETILRGVSLNDKEPAVRILPVDVYGNKEMTSTFDVANGVYQAINAGATTINLSLGSTGDSDFLHNVIKAGAAQNPPILFFAAAGNEPTTDPSYPAAYPEVTAVTAGTKDGSIASYANRGSFVDLAAPGTSVVVFNGQSYYVQGTSASSAFTSGLAAGIRDVSKMTPEQITAALQKLLPFKQPAPTP